MSRYLNSILKDLLRISSIVILCFPLTLYGTTSSSQLASLLNNLHTMQASFIQTPLTQAVEGEQQRGQMALQRPNKFRWEITSPNKQLIIADGKTLWVYDVDLEQVTKKLQETHDINNPAMLLSGSVVSLQHNFSIKLLSTQDIGQWFELKPMTDQGMFEWIRLHFINGKLFGMQLADNLGQKSELLFKNVKTNTALKPTLFHFTPPKGVDVISN